MLGFIVERQIPNASDLTADQLRDFAMQVCAAIEKLGKPYKWHHSYVAGDRLYCLHEAESEEAIREQTQCGSFPGGRVTRITAVIEPLSSDRIIVRR